MHVSLVDLLVCPSCHGALDWRQVEARGDQMQAARGVCRQCAATYPVRDGIALFLLPDPDRNDLWEEAETGLFAALRDDPALERRLLDAPEDSLSGTDLFFRAMALERLGDCATAGRVAARSFAASYTADYLSAWRAEVDLLLERLGSLPPPLVDLACGRGALIDALLAHSDRHVVASDFSPRVLRRNLGRLRALGWADRVSLMAFDALHTPFAERSVGALTTNLGLANLRHGEAVFREVRRVLAGRFLAVTHFYPPGDANTAAIAEAGLSHMLDRHRVADQLAAADLRYTFHNPIHALAAPTPASQVFPGARLDLLPVADTVLEWCLLDAS